ncbi:MAG TPA: TIGR03009 domain-containing protein [Pirellulales bacterium]|nr:TIGR03009 domain-containing protein [Pirellulales bacterium]
MPLRYHRAKIRAFLLMAFLALNSYAAGQETSPRRMKAAPASRRPQSEPRATAPPRNRAAPAKREAHASGRLGNFVPQPRAPRAPWQLDEQQQATLDLVLAAWEKKSSSIKTLTCTFTMWEYDFIFGNGPTAAGDPAKPSRVSRGEIKFAAPDRGVYHIMQQARGDSLKSSKSVKFEPREGAYWVCDGQAVYEFNHDQKKLYERRLPKELKGSAISNGPLPFLFGASAEQMRRRYWLRVSTAPGAVGNEIWLDAVPKYVEDRANYRQASIILDEKTMLPRALLLELPEGNRTSYKFDDFTINSLWKKIIRDFDLPPLPDGWERVVEEAPEAQAGRPAPPPSDLQTLRLKRPGSRK